MKIRNCQRRALKKAFHRADRKSVYAAVALVDTPQARRIDQKLLTWDANLDVSDDVRLLQAELDKLGLDEDLLYEMYMEMGRFCDKRSRGRLRYIDAMCDLYLIARIAQWKIV